MVVALPQGPCGAAAPAQKSASPEPPPIHVKIGRVEIKASQPAQNVVAIRAPQNSGFSDLALMRAHLDRPNR
jgi:hypothetical protein